MYATAVGFPEMYRSAGVPDTPCRNATVKLRSALACALGLAALSDPLGLAKRSSLRPVQRLGGLLPQLARLPCLHRLGEALVVGARAGAAALALHRVRAALARFLHGR